MLLRIAANAMQPQATSSAASKMPHSPRPAKPGMSREDFRKHWTDVHGPLVAGIPEERRHTAYYAQYPRLDSDYDRPNSRMRDYAVVIREFGRS